MQDGVNIVERGSTMHDGVNVDETPGPKAGTAPVCDGAGAKARDGCNAEQAGSAEAIDEDGTSLADLLNIPGRKFATNQRRWR